MRALFLILTFLPVIAFAQEATPPPQLPFITMDAVNRASQNSSTRNWVTSYGSFDASFKQSVGLEVKVRNMTRSDEKASLRWVFFARTMTQNKRFIFAAASRQLSLKPTLDQTQLIDSPLINGTEENYAALGTSYLHGAKYEGWLVQLLSRDDRVIKEVGSTSYIEDLTKGCEFATLVDEYKKRLPLGKKAPDEF